MKVVSWNVKWYDNENKLDVIRDSFEIESVNSFILEKLSEVDFTETGVLVSTGNVQIRIPEEVYINIKPEVKEALMNESLKPDKQNARNAEDPQRYLKERYWGFCKAYIFNFEYFEIKTDLDWGYDGLNDWNEVVSFLPYEHPFIAEFVDCKEKRWGEAGETENIKKWLIIVEEELRK